MSGAAAYSVDGDMPRLTTDHLLPGAEHTYSHQPELSVPLNEGRPISPQPIPDQYLLDKPQFPYEPDFVGQPTLFNQGPGTFGSQGDQDHHFLTRPQSFVSGEHGIVQLPHLVHPGQDLASSSHVTMPHAPRGVTIYTQNVVIEPKVTHVTIQSPKLPLSWMKAQPKPYNKTASETIGFPNPLPHTLFPFVKPAMAATPEATSSQQLSRNHGNDVIGNFISQLETMQEETTMLSIDTKPGQSQENTTRTMVPEQFHPLLSPVRLQTFGQTHPDIMTVVEDREGS